MMPTGKKHRAACSFRDDEFDAIDDMINLPKSPCTAEDWNIKMVGIQMARQSRCKRAVSWPQEGCSWEGEGDDERPLKEGIRVMRRPITCFSMLTHLFGM